MIVTSFIKEFWDDLICGEIIQECYGGGGINLYVREVHIRHIDEPFYGVFDNSDAFYEFYDDVDEALKVMHKESSNRFAFFGY